MATEEARALLDSLMGGDRNAPLPPGAAVPTKRKKKSGGGGGEMMLLLPGKRHKSCYDPDIDPLFTAWGVDVYDLFVNTKSDLGTNPYVVDDGARQEYLALSADAQLATGFPYFLFQKLQELVRTCDRTVTRNKEKLHQELLRKGKTATAANINKNKENDAAVTHVDPHAIEQLARSKIQLEHMQEDLASSLNELEEILAKEEKGKEQLQPLLQKQKQQQQQQQQPRQKTLEEEEKEEKDNSKKEATAETGGPAAAAVKKEEEGEEGGGIQVKKEGEGDQAVKEEDQQVTKTDGQDVEMNDAEQEKQPKLADAAAAVKGEDDAAPKSNDGGNGEEEKVETVKDEKRDDPTSVKDENDNSSSAEGQQDEDETKNEKQQQQEETVQLLQVELGRLTMERQRVLYRCSRILSRLGPAQENIDTQTRHLCAVKSDCVTDKTVCEVSGNFMSARDADERIAAHYAGKQYVGWKLVRDKAKAMVQQYGRHGPPPPAQNNNQNSNQQMRFPASGGGGGGRRLSPLQQQQQPSRGGGGGGYYRGGRGGCGGGGRGRFFDGGGGGYNNRDRGGRWERGGYGGGGGPPPGGGGGMRRGAGGGGGPPPPRGNNMMRR